MNIIGTWPSKEQELKKECAKMEMTKAQQLDAADSVHIWVSAYEAYVPIGKFSARELMERYPDKDKDVEWKFIKETKSLYIDYAHYRRERTGK